MCGISGCVGGGSDRLLDSMLNAIRHRGPDGDGRYVSPDGRVWLGHRRLAVIDLVGGVQPMSNEDSTIHVVFNGEIYNHRELRKDLEAAGHRFRSDHSDTEVLVHGYEEWGEALPGRLNGMFAFAVYDENRRRVFAARDRFGKKPFFYSCGKDSFAFSSELTSLLHHPQVDRTPDYRALQKYFAYAFFPAPHTPYCGARKLPGGHSLVFDVERSEIEIRQYWRFAVEPDAELASRDESSLAEELRALLKSAVGRRLESDVRLGVLLSGGVDSSAIVAFTRELLPDSEIRTYSIGFKERSFDETRFARRVAENFSTTHNEKTFDLEQAKAMLPDLLGRLDEPLGDSSILPTQLVCQFARTGVTVALSGDGGDELFAGYDPFHALAVSQKYRKLCPKPMHRVVERLVGMLPVSDRNMSLDFKLKRWLRGVAHRPALWCPVWMGALGPDEIGDVFEGGIDTEDLYSEAIECWDRCVSTDSIDRTLEFFTNFYLQDGILLKADRASMLASLELRAPFLDMDVVDFARRLPASLKYRNGETKFILKQALKGVVPDDILARKKKGFGIPLAMWLREMSLPDDEAQLANLNHEWFAQKARLHRQGKADYRHALWCRQTLHGHFQAA